MSEKTELQTKIRAMLGSVLLDLQGSQAANTPVIDGSSAPRAVEWSNVRSKPDHYTPSPHTHSEFLALTATHDALQHTCDLLSAKLHRANQQLDRLAKIGQDTAQLRRLVNQLQTQLDQQTSAKNQVQGVLWGQISGVPSELQTLLPVLSQGVPGQVLTRTASGYVWQDVASYVYNVGGSQPQPEPTITNPLLWGIGDTDYILWGSDDDDALIWG